MFQRAQDYAHGMSWPSSRRRFQAFVGRSSAWLYDIAPYPHLIVPVLIVFLLLPFSVGVGLVTTAVNRGSPWTGRLLFAGLGGLVLALLGVLMAAYIVSLRSVLKDQKANGATGRHSRAVE